MQHEPLALGSLPQMPLGTQSGSILQSSKSDDYNSRDLRSFFLGMAKPQLPKFSGEKDQFEDWVEPIRHIRK
jgi:hypothetical protein